MQLHAHHSSLPRQKQAPTLRPRKCVRLCHVRTAAQAASSTTYAPSHVNTQTGSTGFGNQQTPSAGGRVINLASLRKVVNQERTVKFHVRYKCDYGQEVFLVGNCPELGSWEVTEGIRLTWSEGHLWQGQVSVREGTRLQYKYVVRNKDGSVARWQEGANVALDLPGANVKSMAMEVEDSWNQARQIKRILAAGTPVKFNLQKKCEYGQGLVVVGSSPQLGAWDVNKGLGLKWTDGDVWEAAAELPSGESVQYKYVVVNADGSAAEWQEGANLSMSVPQVQTQKGKRRGVLVLDSWQPANSRTAGFQGPGPQPRAQARAVPNAKPPPRTAWMSNPYASTPAGGAVAVHHTEGPRFGSSSSGLGGASNTTERLWQVEQMVGGPRSQEGLDSVHHMWTDKPRFGSSSSSSSTDLEGVVPGQYSPNGSWERPDATAVAGLDPNSSSPEDLVRWQALNSVVMALQHSSELSHWVSDPSDPRMLAADRRLAALTASLSSGLVKAAVA